MQQNFCYCTKNWHYSWSSQNSNRLPVQSISATTHPPLQLCSKDYMTCIQSAFPLISHTWIERNPAKCRFRAQMQKLWKHIKYAGLPHWNNSKLVTFRVLILDPNLKKINIWSYASFSAWITCWIQCDYPYAEGRQHIWHLLVLEP